MEPIDLLKEKLQEYEKALQKSFVSFRDAEISSELHETHKTNLYPKIFRYKQAIYALEMWLD